MIAADKGLRIPMVYNCAGYEHLHTLKLLDGVIDIYLPDAKYADNRNALRTSKMHHYVEYNRAALKEMYRQVGGLEVDEHGIAVRGLIVRHLVMPHDHAGTKAVLALAGRRAWLRYRPQRDGPVFPRLQGIQRP